MPAAKVCKRPGCPHIATYRGWCEDDARKVEQARGTRQQRGYDAAHDRERRRWARIIARRPVPCARCGEPITADMEWDLGHTDDRTAWSGPEHARECNRSAGGRAAHLSE